jgi:hypothetical protein
MPTHPFFRAFYYNFTLKSTSYTPSNIPFQKLRDQKIETLQFCKRHKEDSYHPSHQRPGNRYSKNSGYVWGKSLNEDECLEMQVFLILQAYLSRRDLKPVFLLKNYPNTEMRHLQWLFDRFFDKHFDTAERELHDMDFWTFCDLAHFI